MTDLLIKFFIKNPKNTNDEKVRTKYGTLASVTGIFLNALLFLAKLAVGILTASVAIVADAFNNIADAGSSLVTMLGFRLAAKPVDKEHPLGHGRFEYIAGFLVDLAILLVGAELLFSCRYGSVFQCAVPREWGVDRCSYGDLCRVCCRNARHSHVDRIAGRDQMGQRPVFERQKDLRYFGGRNGA